MSHTAGTGAVRGDRTADRKTAAQKIAMVMGIVFLLVGVLGFVPGITSNYSEMSFAGHESGAMLLGVFQVSILHNLVHLLFGIAGLVLARAHRSAVNYLIVGGIIYAVLFIYGMLVPMDSAANFVPVNSADNWLHLGLALVMVIAGIATRRSDENTAATAH